MPLNHDILDEVPLVRIFDSVKVPGLKVICKQTLINTWAGANEGAASLWQGHVILKQRTLRQVSILKNVSFLKTRLSQFSPKIPIFPKNPNFSPKSQHFPSKKYFPGGLQLCWWLSIRLTLQLLRLSLTWPEIFSDLAWDLLDLAWDFSDVMNLRPLFPFLSLF